MNVNNALNGRTLNTYGSAINDNVIYNRLISLIEQYNRLAIVKGLPLKKAPVYTSRINETLLTRAINAILNDIDKLRAIKDRDNGPPLRYGFYNDEFPNTNSTFVIDSWKYTVKTDGETTFLNVTINDTAITEMPEDLPFNVITDATGNMLNVTDMLYLFGRCTSLTRIDLSNFNTSNVTEMTYMFANCTSLTRIDLSNFNTSNVGEMVSMFAGCSALSTITLYKVSANLLPEFPVVTDITEWYADGMQLTNAVWKDSWGDGPVTFTRTIQSS